MASPLNSINQKCLESLQKADLENRIAIVGSGPSYPVSTPIGKLEDALCEACHVNKDKSYQFWDLAELAYQSNPQAYLQTLKKCFGNTANLQVRLYDHIVGINFKSIVTLNYDDQLAKAFVQKNENTNNYLVYPPTPGEAIFCPEELIYGSTKLQALHGIVTSSPDWEKNIILRTGDYEKHYLGKIQTENTLTETHHAPLFEWWKSLLLSVPCIFIGTTLNEPGISTVIQHLYSSQRNRLHELKHIHLLPGQESDFSNRPPAPTLKCINKIFYDPINNDHKGLLYIFSNLSGIRLSTIPSKIKLPSTLSNPSAEDFNGFE